MSISVRETVERAALAKAVRERRSIRAFSDEPVRRELVARLLQDALWAPSPHNSQPWRFTVLFNTRDKAMLASAMADQLRHELRADRIDEDVIARQTARSEQRISTAPVVILCSLVPDGLVTFPDERRTRLEREMAVQSVGGVLQTLFLLAWAEGIGSCWMAAPMYCPEVVRRVLRLPDTFEPQALALLGYPANPGKVRNRRPIDDVVELR